MTTAGFFKNQQGFSDVARRFALQMGLPPSFRDFAEDALGRVQLPFAIAAATGRLPRNGVPLSQFVQSPAGFEQFLQGRGEEDLFNPRGGGQALRDAGSFLRYQAPPTDLRVSQGQELLRSLLLGPSGSVGTELFTPAINLATQDTGRRFLPGLGAAARRAVANALQNLLAQEPGRFTDLPSFVDYLSSEGVI